MGDYQFQAWDLNTNTLLTELAATGVSYSERLNDAGQCSFNLSLTDPGASQQTRIIQGLGGVPFKFLILANQGQTIMYAGIIWTPNMDSSSPFLKCSGKALPGYFQQITPGRGFTDWADPADILTAVINDSQKRTGSNIWLGTRQQLATRPPVILPNYPLSQYVTAAQIMSDVTASITPGSGGTDYYVEHNFDGNGVPVHTAVICSPRAGRDSTTSQAVVNLDNMKWTWPTDASKAGNHAIVVGSGSGGVQPTAHSYDRQPIGGLGQPPLLEQVYQYSAVTNQQQLQKIADGTIQMYGRPVVTPTVTIPANDPALPLGSFLIGDDILVTASPSVWFPQGKNEWWRIVSYTVNIPDEGPASYTITLNRPPIF